MRSSFAIALLGLAMLSDGLPAAEAARPNILWLSSEDHGPHLGCYGDAFGERLMHVLVVMRLREMQIDPDPHQHRSTDEGQGRCLAKQRERQSSTDEGGRREIGACSG